MSNPRLREWLKQQPLIYVRYTGPGARRVILRHCLELWYPFQTWDEFAADHPNLGRRLTIVNRYEALPPIKRLQLREPANPNIKDMAWCWGEVVSPQSIANLIR